MYYAAKPYYFNRIPWGVVVERELKLKDILGSIEGSKRLHVLVAPMTK
jgi:hypothetical protein